MISCLHNRIYLTRKFHETSNYDQRIQHTHNQITDILEQHFTYTTPTIHNRLQKQSVQEKHKRINRCI